MKINIIRYSMIVLLIGLAAMSYGRASAQRSEIHLESFSWGMSSGQIARISLAHAVLLDGSTRANDPIIARIQLLDTEGEGIAQSGELTVAPGKTRFWDVPRELLPAGEPTGRLQVRARILVTTHSFDVNRNPPPLAPSVELIAPATGRTVMSFNAFVNFGDIKGE
jgi:hypothetical protein